MRAIEMMTAMLTLTVVTAVDTLQINSELAYTTTTPCESITKHLPEQYELAGLLLPNEKFGGEISLTKNVVDTVDQTRCMLHLRIKGELVVGGSSGENVFELASGMDQKLTELVETQYLRGSEGRLQDLKLKNIHVTLNKREYAISLQPDIDTQENRDAQLSQVTMSDGESCLKLNSEDVLRAILPNGIVNVEEMNTQQLVSDEDLTSTKCTLGLHVVTQVPSFGSNEEAFALLETIDDNVKDYFGVDTSVDGTKRALISSVTMQFVTKAAIQSASVLATDLRAQSMNPPTKEIAMGIVMGMVLLGMMLMGMTYQKKRHEQHCQERHEKASRVAQIHRVSYCMGYSRVPVEDEEEKDGIL